MLTLEQFKEARNVLQGVLRPTPLIHSPYLSKSCGNNVYLKPENMQVTGAYKIRGAYYKISTLTDEEKARGLVTASAGNHAQGVAYAAQAAGVAATIVMPTTTPLVKVNNTKDYGANVVLHGEVFDDAAELAAQLAEEQGLTYVHPFNDLTLATGQGTIAYEIFQDLPDVDVILIPIGGGGLAAGVSTLAKLLNPNVEVIGVEPTGAASMKASLEAGHVVTLPTASTIADGVAVKTSFSRTDCNVFVITTATEACCFTEEEYALHKDIVREAVCGRSTLLLKNGEQLDQSGNTMPVAKMEPRTAIGVSQDGKEVYLMVVDGRNFYYSNGADLLDLMNLMSACGASDALNLDGGGSSTFIARDGAEGELKLLNWPTDQDRKSTRLNSSHRT